MSETIITKTVPTFYFIGVTTQKSSIMKVFPLWMKLLGRENVVIEGVDLKIHDTREAYRAITAQIKYDPLSLGALVTTHKVDLYQAAGDMFDDLDAYAQLIGEISCISKLEGRLKGHAKDPLTGGLTLDAMIGPNYFGKTGAQVLIFGAGGSSAALIVHLMMKPDKVDRPDRLKVVDHLPGRLDNVREMVERIGTDIKIDYIYNEDPRVNDDLMAGLPDYSIVINATGMGKDTPGSPITDAGLLPMHGLAWEFNYRGELNFLHQSQAQVESRSVKVEDGWLYFVNGWSLIAAEVLHFDLTADLFAKLEAAAALVRG